MDRTGAEIRYEILRRCRLQDGNIDYKEYPKAEALVLEEATEEERVAYNMYMARVTGVVLCGRETVLRGCLYNVPKEGGDTSGT